MSAYTEEELAVSIAATKTAIEAAKKAIETGIGDAKVVRSRLRDLREQLDWEQQQLDMLQGSTTKRTAQVRFR